MAVLCFSYQTTRTWYLVSNVLQTPVSNIIATRNGMNPLVDMMAVVVERKIVVLDRKNAIEVLAGTYHSPSFQTRGEEAVETRRGDRRAVAEARAGVK
jgi:hypothetical protein